MFRESAEIKSIEVTFKTKEPKVRYINNSRVESFWYIYEDAAGELYRSETYEGEKFRMYFLSNSKL